jgi:hypothetical protein
MSYLEKKSYVDDCRSIIEFKAKDGTGGTERRDRMCAGVRKNKFSLRTMSVKTDKTNDTKKILV